MKKSKIIVALAVAATMSLGGAFALTGCDNSDGGHTHSYTKWNYDTEGHHWKECPDDGVKDDTTYGEHHFDGDTDTTCECGYVREVEIAGTVSGTVTAYGKALSGVKVTVGDKSTTTGSNGKFSLDGITTESEVTVTFSKTGYINVEKKIATSDWTEKATTLDAVMRLTEEKATVSGVVKVGSKAMSGATVTLGDKAPVTTGADGTYSFEVNCSEAANLTLTVTHPYCENYSGTVAVAAGSTTVTKNVSLTSKTISELGGKSLVELNSITASPASDYNFATSGKGNWAVNTDSFDQANEGLLFHEAGQDIASGSKELKLYAYNRFIFDGMQQIRVSATRFSDPLHNPNLQGGGYPEVYVLLVAEDGTVIKPQEDPGKVEKVHSQFNELTFTFENKITGVYALAVGTTRGNRVAIESVKYLGEEITGTVTGTIKQNDAALSGAEVAFGQTTVNTGNDGTFSIDVSVRKGGSDKITVSYDGISMEIPFTSENLASGTYNVGEKVLKAKPLPGISQEQLDALPASPAADYNFASQKKGDWIVNTTSFDQANEGLLLHEAGQDIASGSTELKLFAYKKLTFDGMQQVRVSATRFNDPGHNPNLQGYPEVYVLLVASDGTVIKPQEAPGKVEKTHSEFNNLVFTFDEVLTGNYVFAVGTTRGNRVAIESVKFRGEEVTGKITGTIKQGGAALEGADVTFGSTTVQTGSDGTFSINVSVRKGGSDKITVSKDGVSMDISFTAENLASGTYNVGEKVLKAKPLPGISQEQLDALPAAAAPDMSGIDKIKDAIGDNSWLKVGDQSGANEGWLFKDAGYAEEGSTELKVFTYKKLTFDNMGTIIVRARTFGGQNSVSGHDGQIYPEIIIKIIDGDGNTVAVTSTYTKVDSENTCRDYYFKLNGEIKGDYTFAIGMARGMRMAVESIKFSRAMTSVNVTGTVKSSGLPVAGATVKYGYNRGSTVTGTDGSFTLPVDIAEGESVEVTITKDGFADIVKTVSDATSAAIGEVVFVKTVLPNLTTEDIAGMTVETATSFNQQALNGWRSYGDVDKGHGEGTCLQANANSPAYICAKFTIADGNKFMKFQARMFVRDSDQRGLLQVKVIKADGTVETIAPVRVYHANEVLTDKVLNGNTLINDAEYYTEGVYDLSAYVGQTVVIAIFAVNDVEPVTKSIHNAINDVTFKSNSDTEFGKPAVTQD